MRTDTEYNTPTSDRPTNYFTGRPTLGDSGLSDAVYQLGKRLADQLARQQTLLAQQQAARPSGAKVVTP